MGADDPRDFPDLQRKAAAPVPSTSNDKADDRPEVTHDLLLADGSAYESSGSIPSHVAVGDRVIPVLSVTERQ